MTSPGSHSPTVLRVAARFKVFGDVFQGRSKAPSNVITRIMDLVELIDPSDARTADDEDEDGEEEDEDGEEDVEEVDEDVEEVDADVEEERRLLAAPILVSDAFAIVMGMAEVRASLRFELVPLLRRVHDNVLAGKAAAMLAPNGKLETSHAHMLGGGKCQSRKTPLKFVTFLMCRLMGVPTVLITTGTSGRDDLFLKFSQLLAGVVVPHLPIASADTEIDRWHYVRGGDGMLLPKLTSRPLRSPESIVLRLPDLKPKDTKWVNEQLLKGACVISNNSAAAIKRLSLLVHGARNEARSRLFPNKERMQPLQFALVIDEADDFYRTDGSFVKGQESKRIQMEKALGELCTLGPLIKFEVTATLLAIFVILTASGKADNVPAEDIFYTYASSEYVGTDLFRPPLNAAGDPIFLELGSLIKSNCYIDEKVKLIWADAASNGRSLLLDATTAAVTAAGNTTQKAERLLTLHPHALVVVVSGSFIKWRTAQPHANCRNDKLWTEFTGKARIFAEILKFIDARYPAKPIIVFGYSQLMRGISYRSALRVPTHLILLFGSSMSLCRLVQAAGRTNGEQLCQLNQGGFDHVKVLTPADDFDTIRNYPAFLEAIKAKMENDGLSLRAALASRQEGKFNFPGRSLAQKKLHLNELQPNIIGPFDRPQPGDLLGAESMDQDLKEGGKDRGWAVLEVLIECQAYDEENAMTSTDVVRELETGAYDEPSGQEVSKMSTHNVLSVLQQHTIEPQHREALFIKHIFAKQRPRFFINEAGLAYIRPHPVPSNPLALAASPTPDARAPRRVQVMRDAIVPTDGDEGGSSSATLPVAMMPAVAGVGGSGGDEGACGGSSSAMLPVAVMPAVAGVGGSSRGKRAKVDAPGSTWETAFEIE
ncbi:hypothetical protein T492DRAFT_1120957 [Pavlovales sp. CCMP2436]|nr:hypothetical protein T492DRAFT_1120957 [Pavlovales sp. CCMP2436]